MYRINPKLELLNQIGKKSCSAKSMELAVPPSLTSKRRAFVSPIQAQDDRHEGEVADKDNEAWNR